MDSLRVPVMADATSSKSMAIAAAAVAALSAFGACSSSSGESRGGFGGGVGSGGSPGAGGSPGSGGGEFGGAGGGVLMTDSGGGGGPQGDGAICGSVEVPSTVETVEVEVPGNVLVLFDASNSMNSNFSTPSGPQPKFVAAGDALIAAIDPIKDKLTVGTIFFPTVAGTILLCSSNVDSIFSGLQINFVPGTQFAAAWSTWWTGNGLKLGTPMNRAFDQADAALTQSGLQGGKAVVLIADGEPVCMDGTPAQVRAAGWLAQGIKTYVIGLTSNAGASFILNDIASQGGTGPMALAITDSAQLQTQLEQIATTTITTMSTINDCNIVLDPPPANLNDVFVVVTIGGQDFQVARDMPNGWTLSSDGRTATLTGTVCDDAKAGAFEGVRVEFGCVDLPPLVR